MNIICNNCGGADCYNLCNQQFNNPFIWSCIFANDMIELIKNYKNINFKNIDLIRLSKETVIKNNYNEYMESKKVCGIKIDNIFTVYYTHYIYDYRFTIPTIKGPDILYFRNFEYVYKKYKERLDRMLMLKEKPSFLIIAYKRHGWSDEELKKIISLDTEYNIVIITDKMFGSKNENIHIINIKNLDTKYFYPLDVIKYKKDEIFENLGIKC